MYTSCCFYILLIHTVITQRRIPVTYMCLTLIFFFLQRLSVETKLRHITP